MPIRISVTLPGKPKAAVEVDILPDTCPHCHMGGKQIPLATDVVLLRKDFSTEHVLYLPMRCPRHQCGKPFYAFYEEPPFDHQFMSGRAYRLKSCTPWTPLRQQRDPVIATISPDFYEILDQAMAAEAFRLPLVAGAGFRKALEYLVKDYVVTGVKSEARKSGERADGETVQAKIEGVLNRQLGGKHGVIAMIRDEKLQRVAERAVWLGNDEVHYTRKWDDKDIGDLKTVIGLVVTIITSEASYQKLLDDMPTGKSH